jgi:hypothetical protein
MKCCRYAIAIGTGLALFAMFPNGRAAAADAGKQTPAAMNRVIKVTLRYLSYLPTDYDQDAAIAPDAEEVTSALRFHRQTP